MIYLCYPHTRAYNDDPMMNDFITGFSSVFAGISHTHRPKVRRFVVIPFCINITLFGLGLWYAYTWFQGFVDFMPTWMPEALTGFWSWLDTPYQWFRGLFSWVENLLWGMFFSVYLLIVFYTFTILANIISSPFNGYFSAAVEKRLLHTQAKIEAHVDRTMGEEIKITAINESHKLLYSLFRLIPLLIISAILFFIPVVNAIIPVLWFIYGAWMMAVIYIEAPLSNYGLTFKHEKQILNENRWLSLGFGSAIMLMTMIPVLNFFAVPAGVSGATVLFHAHLRRYTQNTTLN